MKKLTRQAAILIFAGIIFLLLAFGLFFIKDHIFVSQQADDYTVKVVVENQQLTSVYIDAYASNKTNEGFTYQPLTIEEGTTLLDYTISQDQTFYKYMELYGPNGTDILTDQSKQVITHYAYSMLLSGDIIEKTNNKTNEVTYEITNATISYNRIPMVLLANSNSVCLKNTKGTKEKIVNLQEFIDALNSIENRKTMISWS